MNLAGKIALRKAFVQYAVTSIVYVYIVLSSHKVIKIIKSNKAKPEDPKSANKDGWNNQISSKEMVIIWNSRGIFHYQLPLHKAVLSVTASLNIFKKIHKISLFQGDCRYSPKSLLTPTPSFKSDLYKRVFLLLNTSLRFTRKFPPLIWRYCENLCSSGSL